MGKHSNYTGDPSKKRDFNRSNFSAGGKFLLIVLVILVLFVVGRVAAALYL